MGVRVLPVSTRCVDDTVRDRGSVFREIFPDVCVGGDTRGTTPLTPPVEGC